MGFVLEAIRRLREHWSLAPTTPNCHRPIAYPQSSTGANGSFPTPPAASSSVTSNTCLNRQTIRAGARRVQTEFADWIARAAASDPWLAAHPPQIEWTLGGVPPAEVFS